MRCHSLVSILLATLALLLPPAAATAQTLAFDDLTTGITLGPPYAFPLIPGHLVRVRITGSPGDRTLFALSTSPPSQTLFWNGTPIDVDLATVVVLWDGVTQPTAPVIGPNGVAEVVFALPWNPSVGTLSYAQGAVIPLSGPSLLTNGRALRSSGEPVVPIESGLNSTHPLAGTGGTLIIQDGPSWGTFFGLHAGPTALPPPVDFLNFIVYARFLGSFPTIGLSVSIDEYLVDPAGVLQVYVTQITGGPPPPPIPSQPYAFALIPRSAFGGTFVENLRLLALP